MQMLNDFYVKENLIRIRFEGNLDIVTSHKPKIKRSKKQEEATNATQSQKQWKIEFFALPI